MPARILSLKIYVRRTQLLGYQSLRQPGIKKGIFIAIINIQMLFMFQYTYGRYRILVNSTLDSETNALFAQIFNCFLACRTNACYCLCLCSSPADVLVSNCLNAHTSFPEFFIAGRF